MMEIEIELFPESIDHTNHDSQWVVRRGGNEKAKCVACIVFLCADASEANVKKRHFLAELFEIVRQNQCNVVSKFQNTLSAVNHMLEMLFSLICSSDVILSDLASEGIILIFTRVTHENGVQLTMNKIAHLIKSLPNIYECLPIIKLTGNLLKKFPSTVKIFMNICTEGKFFVDVLEKLVLSLSYPNDSIKSSTLFLFVHLLKEIEKERVSSHLKSQLIAEVFKILKREQTYKLLVNGMALLQLLIQDECLLNEIFETTIEDATFPLILKKVLLCQECQLQIAAVQCLKLALYQNNFDLSKANLIMENDVLEIFFEILTSDNQILIDSIFYCLLQFADCEDFFLKCHSMFGIEPILRSTEQLFITNCIASITTPLILLQKIFQRQPQGVTLFSTSFSMQLAISVLLLGINSSQRNISLEATRAVQYFLRKDILLMPISLEEIKKILLSCSEKTSELFSHQWKIAAKKKMLLFTQTKITQEEKFLVTKLEVFREAIKLIRECKLDPVSFEDTFKVPKQTCNDSAVMEELTSFSIKLLDDIFMPTFFENINLFSTSDIHVAIINCLLDLYYLSTGTVRQFYIHLSKLGFLEKLWNMSFELNQIYNTDELKTVCHLLLQKMLVSLNDNLEDIEEFSSNIISLKNFDGTLKDCIYLLREFSEQPELFQFQKILLEVLYFHYIFSESRVVDSAEFLEILSTFIQNIAGIDLLSKSTLKHLLFLFAISYARTDLNDQHSPFISTSMQVIIDSLKGFANDLGYLFTLHNDFVSWIFSFPDITDIFGSIAMNEWMNHFLIAQSEDDLKMMISIFYRSGKCLELFLDFLVENGQTIPNIYNLVNHIIFGVESDILFKIRYALMIKFCDLVHKENEKFLEFIITILHKIKNNQCVDNFPADLKLTSRVCTILITTNNNEVLSWCCNYLNSIITKCFDTNDSTALAIVLSTTQVLEKMLLFLKNHDSSVQYSSVILLGTLIHYQFKFKIKVTFKLQLEFEDFQKLLRSQKAELTQSAIYLFAVLLKISFKSDFFTLLRTIENGRVNSNTFRIIYIHLQNAANQSDEVLVEVAFNCIRHLLVFVQKHDEELGNHLFRQPWIGTLLESQLKQMLNIHYQEMRLVLALFLDSKVNNNDLRKFVIKFINFLASECKSLTDAERHIAVELITKLQVSTSVYNEILKSDDIKQSIEKILTTPE